MLVFSSAGFDIDLTDARESEELEQAVRIVRSFGGNALAFASDLGEIAEHDAFDAVERELGPFDCLVNNAGVSVIFRGDLLAVTPLSCDRCLNFKTRGTFCNPALEPSPKMLWSSCARLPLAASPTALVKRFASMAAFWSACTENWRFHHEH